VVYASIHPSKGLVPVGQLPFPLPFCVCIRQVPPRVWGQGLPRALLHTLTQYLGAHELTTVLWAFESC
jgi:RimJ/RimL family protein N-acetyltransferase